MCDDEIQSQPCAIFNNQDGVQDGCRVGLQFGNSQHFNMFCPTAMLFYLRYRPIWSGSNGYYRDGLRSIGDTVTEILID